MLTPPPHIINFLYVTEWFHEIDLDVGLVWFTIQRYHKVNWADVHSLMEESLFLYDVHVGRIVGLPVRECCEITLT